MLMTRSSVLLSHLMTLFKCISGSKLWMAENFLKLAEDESEGLIMNTSHVNK